MIKEAYYNNPEMTIRQIEANTDRINERVMEREDISDPYDFRDTSVYKDGYEAQSQTLQVFDKMDFIDIDLERGLVEIVIKNSSGREFRASNAEEFLKEDFQEAMWS